MFLWSFTRIALPASQRPVSTVFLIPGIISRFFAGGCWIYSHWLVWFVTLSGMKCIFNICSSVLHYLVPRSWSKLDLCYVSFVRVGHIFIVLLGPTALFSNGHVSEKSSILCACSFLCWNVIYDLVLLAEDAMKTVSRCCSNKLVTKCFMNGHCSLKRCWTKLKSISSFVQRSPHTSTVN